MKRIKNWCFIGTVGICLILIGCVQPPRIVEQRSASIDTPVMDAISAAVYEVVVPKPATDSLQYEKPLPLELLPYYMRTDKYYSIGTAFAIDASSFVSAAHVLDIGAGSQFKEIFLRDKDGNVYSIDKILKYSSNRDFVVFSLRDTKATRALIVDTKPRLNQKIYAVGNALGEGIVMRDGLYTSNTPEQENGEWNWIRFSAAASPGNSGGPLIDQTGKVIGIVRGKSPNENLNYAVPMSEVINAPAHKAVIENKEIYFIDNMDINQIDTLKKEIDLPMTIAELDKEIYAVNEQFNKRLINDLLEENKNVIFPNGTGSTRMLYRNYSAIFPHLIMKDKDGNWDAFQPREIKEADLGNNGLLRYGSLGYSEFMHLRKPDDIPLKQLYEDPKLFMELILKSGEYYRTIGPEKIKITSMGKAFEDYRYTDTYGRIWMVRTWLIEYSDYKVITFSLPVPDGCVTMMRIDQTGSIDTGHILDLKALADFIYISYYGTFDNWEAFLAMKDFLPAVFSSIDIRIEKNKVFRYTSKRFSQSYGPDVMNVSEKTGLTLYFSYFMDQGRTVWDVTGISMGEEKYANSIASVHRKMKPPISLGDKSLSKWKDMNEQRFPYNQSAYFKDGRTKIAKRFMMGSAPQGASPEASVLYTVNFSKPGNIEQDEMKTKLDKLSNNLIVHENTRGEGTKADQSL